MNLTAKDILLREIVTGVSEENIAQIGIDLNVVEIYNIGSGGLVPVSGKTKLPNYTLVDPVTDSDSRKIWVLSPGMYQVKFSQGCKIPLDCSLDLFPRSSLARIGGDIVSPKWDPGFYTNQMGSFLVVHKTLMIEEGARIAQACVTLNPSVENPYNGQFQGK